MVKVIEIKFESGFASSNLSSEGKGRPRGNLGVPLENKGGVFK